MRYFDNCECFLFDKNLPEDISLPESLPEAVAHDAQLYILELEQVKVSAGCLLNPGELLNSEQLLYSCSMYVRTVEHRGLTLIRKQDQDRKSKCTRNETTG